MHFCYDSDVFHHGGTPRQARGRQIRHRGHGGRLQSGERTVPVNALIFTTEENENTEKGGENLGLGEKRDCYNGDVFHHSLSRRSSKNEDGRKMRTLRKTEKTINLGESMVPVNTARAFNTGFTGFHRVFVYVIPEIT